MEENKKPKEKIKIKLIFNQKNFFKENWRKSVGLHLKLNDCYDGQTFFIEENYKRNHTNRIAGRFISYLGLIGLRKTLDLRGN